MKCTHVEFSYIDRQSVIVPLTEAFAWADAQAKMWEPTRLLYAPNSEGLAACLASGRRTWDAACQQWRLVSIGGGACSYSTVLYRHI